MRPPGASSASSSFTDKPARSRRTAQQRPAIPAPTMATSTMTASLAYRAEALLAEGYRIWEQSSRNIAATGVSAGRMRKRIMKPRFKSTFLPALLLAGAIIVLLNAWWALQAVRTLATNAFWVAHSWQVVHQVERVLGSALHP